MWSIPEEENESNTEEEFPEGLHELTRAKLRLVRIGAPEDEDSQQESEIDLDGYLDTQRLSTSKNVPRKRQKTSEELQIEKEYADGYGIGFKMFQKMGYTNVLKGLGKNEQGRTSIVEAEFKTALTARDEDEPDEDEKVDIEKEKDSEERKLEEQAENDRKYNEYKFEELFCFRSKIPHVNHLLLALRNKYETLQARLSLFERESESFERDMEISRDLKLQKEKEMREVDEEIEGLESIEKSTGGISRHPHLGIKYNCDLLVVKESVQKMCDLPLREIAGELDREVKRMKKTLTSMFLAKEQEALRGYYGESEGEDIMQRKIREYRSKTGAKVSSKLMAQPSPPRTEGLQEIALPEQDASKIHQYVRLLIEETVVNNKLQTYLESKRDISYCEEFVIDLIETMQVHCADAVDRIKSKLLIPLANAYLRRYDPQPKQAGREGKEKGLLPYHVIFPWLRVLKLPEIDLEAFLYRVCTRVWEIETMELWEFISPWLKHMPTERSKFFINFYLAPRMLREMENFPLGVEGKERKVKGLLEGFRKYFTFFEYIPIAAANFKQKEQILEQLKKNMMQSSILLILLQLYKRESACSENSPQDVAKWARRWESQMDALCPGAMREFFLNNGVNLS